jgi:hypothetical protein
MYRTGKLLNALMEPDSNALNLCVLFGVGVPRFHLTPNDDFMIALLNTL